MSDRRQQQRQSRRFAERLPVQLAVGIAGDDQVVATLQALIGQRYRRHALGAGARARKRHQQGGHVALQVIARPTDQIRGRDGFHPLAERPQQFRRQALADVGGSARASQDDAQVVDREQRLEEGVDPLPLGAEQAVRLPPGVRLLRDFARGPASAVRGQERLAQSQILHGIQALSSGSIASNTAATNASTRPVSLSGCGTRPNSASAMMAVMSGAPALASGATTIARP